MLCQRTSVVLFLFASGCEPRPFDDAATFNVPNARIPDVPVSDVPDAPVDAPSDVPIPPAGTTVLRGGFVSSAVPSGAAGDRFSGGFSWQGHVQSARLEGWLR